MLKPKPAARSELSEVFYELLGQARREHVEASLDAYLAEGRRRSAAARLAFMERFIEGGDA